MPPTIRFEANVAYGERLESDGTFWCPPTVDMTLDVLPYGRHAMQLRSADGPFTETPLPESEGSARDEAGTGPAPARERRWRAVRSVALRFGGWAAGRSD